MGPLLPPNTSGVYWHLLLPDSIGGLGLWLEEDIPILTNKLPDPTKSYLIDLVAGRASDQDTTYFKGFTHNVSYRGYELLESEISLVREFLITELIAMMPGYPMHEARIMAGISDNLSLKQVKNRLKGLTWLTEEEVYDSLLRPFLFKQILSGEAKVSAFNTESFKSRYSKLWDIYFKGSPVLDEETLRKAMKLSKTTLFYNFSEKMATPIRGEILDVNLIEEMTLGLPDLQIRWTDIGTLSEPIRQEEPEFSYGEYV